MVSDTADVANEVAPAAKRDRCVQRTVDLSDAEIAAAAAADMTQPAKPRHASSEAGAKT